MKKFALLILVFCCALALFLPSKIDVAFANSSVVKVNVETAKIYKQATSDISGENIVLATVEFGQELELLSSSVIDGADGLKYYNVKLYNKAGETPPFHEGYIVSSFVISSTQNSLKTKLDYNAKVITTTKVYQQSGEEFVETAIQLEKGTELKIIDGYDKANKFTHASYQINGETFTGFFLTADVQPNGVNNFLIITLFVLLAIVVAVLTVYLIIRSGKKKKKKIKKTA